MAVVVVVVVAEECFPSRQLDTSHRRPFAPSTTTTMATRALLHLAARRTSPALRRHQSTAAAQISVLGQSYPTDAYTNITPSIVSKFGQALHAQPGHPLCTLRTRIEHHFADYAHLSPASPLVTPYQNFDSLSFPADHPGRARTDSYYLNRDLMLRTHTSAHEVDTFRSGAPRWLLTADVYRRDEIDASHYPVFHQMEGASLFGADPASARASSSTSSNVSCFTAFIEYAHAPAANPAITTPVAAFLHLYGSRARMSPGDITCACIRGSIFSLLWSIHCHHHHRSGGRGARAVLT